MNKKETEQKVQSRKDYLKPEVEVFRLGKSLNFLEQSFSSNGELEPFQEGDELGVDDQGNPIA